MMREGVGATPVLLGEMSPGVQDRGEGGPLGAIRTHSSRQTHKHEVLAGQKTNTLARPHTNAHAPTIPCLCFHSRFLLTHSLPSLVPARSLLQALRWRCQTAAWTAWCSRPGWRQQGASVSSRFIFTVCGLTFWILTTHMSVMDEEVTLALHEVEKQKHAPPFCMTRWIPLQWPRRLYFDPFSKLRKNQQPKIKMLSQTVFLKPFSLRNICLSLINTKS